MSVKHIIKINLPGGIVSPGDLFDILMHAEAAGADQLRFGNRQQLFFLIDADKLEDLADALMVDDVVYEVDADLYPNILSSYVTEEILSPTNWLREGTYKDILNAFNYQPKLKINIVDYAQNLIPFFTGHLNFVSSEVSNFWYLHIRFPKGNEMYSWPTLVYSEDVAALCKVLEPEILSSTEIIGVQLYKKISENQHFIQQEYAHSLIHTDFQLPYYEGFNRYGNHKLWLGIYRRKEEFSVSFLKEVCEICKKTRLGQLYTTAWKSLVIKSIKDDDRKYWSHLMNKHRINVRHAANELNWSIEDVCDEALALKINLVKHFEEVDLRTYRLCFAIKTKPNTGLFGSVIIRKRNEKNRRGEELYEVMHSKNFNPNNKEYVSFAMPCNQKELKQSLIKLTDYYYGLQLNVALPEEVTELQHPKAENENVYQCNSCKTIYNKVYGDEFNHVVPGTKFEDLSAYTCPVCDAPKENFSSVSLNKMLI
ncbi:rubredoxin [Pedobacter sp. UYP30]|uniref:rubredoxin n=1 Tax=Pedobacter sp. UYP30 TaxID=1756400 RepID=UPI003390799E